MDHVATDQCGFDRTASRSEGVHVCACGWREEPSAEQASVRIQNPGGENPPSEPAPAAGPARSWASGRPSWPAPTSRVTAAQAAGESVEQKIGRLERENADLCHDITRLIETCAELATANEELRRQLEETQSCMQDLTRKLAGQRFARETAEAALAQDRAEREKASVPVAWGPERQDHPGGPIYRVGTSTGIDAAPQPTGGKWVPFEPTPAMVRAAYPAIEEDREPGEMSHILPEDIYRAMIAAAPVKNDAKT